ncbi:cytoplasmic protein [Tumebacillus avium]|uniref:Cytoplasmic protein n=1 Tax=Tumebacillus avium TaxID=1903704 RepID=A0A1Y0IML3_9BACL|nr:DUF4180 domain-containing protein [Tumebacillus avium]ARU60765.1 cytoplasmic protein [Tumebacillus avium]
MKIRLDRQGNSQVAIVESAEVVIHDVQDALDLMATVRYESGSSKILIPKANITEEFFDLKTRLAGEILQKFTNYQVQIAIVGDFDGYASKSLQSFIYECNRGNQVFFAKDLPAGLQALHGGN